MTFIAAAAPVLGLIGAGTSAAGTIMGGIAAGNAASYRAAVAKNNQIIAEQNATYATAAGQASAAATSLKGAAAGARVKAAQAANGVDVNSGSAVDVQVSQREQEKLDTETVLNNAALQAYGYRSQATGFEAQSQLEQMTAQQAPIGAGLSAGGGLLSNASSVGFRWGGAPAGGGGAGMPLNILPG